MEVIKVTDSRPIDVKKSIEVNDWRVGTDRLAINGVGSNIVLVAHNMSGNTSDQRRSTGLLGNFSMLGSTKSGDKSRSQFQAALETLPSLGKKPETEIWLGGGAIGLPGRPNTASADRSYAEQLALLYLGRHGLSKELLSLEWAPPLNVSAVELDCRTGIVSVQHTFDPQHFRTQEQK